MTAVQPIALRSVQRCVDDYLAGRQFPLDVFPADYA